MNKIKNLNDIRKIKPHTLKKPTNEEIMEAFSKKYAPPNTDIILTSDEGVKLFEEALKEYNDKKE